MVADAPPRRSTVLLRWVVIGAAVAVAGAGCGTTTHRPPTAAASATPGVTAPQVAGGGAAWPEFGVDPQRSDVSSAATGIGPANVGTLRRRSVHLPGTVDSSPIYLPQAVVDGGRRNVFVMTTTYGVTLALGAGSGRILWTYRPPGLAAWLGSPRITTATPVAGPGGYVYAAAPDGRIHKLALADGHEVHTGGWPARVTLDPAREKLAAALNLDGPDVVATTSGYFGDQPPYQGHVVTIDRSTGRIVSVFNVLCSDRHHLVAPASCPAQRAGIWARAGAVVVPGTGRLLVATGNGDFNGRTDWAQSVLELSPGTGALLGTWTLPHPSATSAADVDLGSTAPALLPVSTGTLVLQGGKDGVLHLVRLPMGSAAPAGAGPVAATQVSQLPAPGGAEVLTQPAVWTRGGRTTVFVATGGGTAAYRLVGPPPRLTPLWHNATPGTSPVLAGNLVYVFDPRHGALDVYLPDTGRRVAVLPAAPGHWNSPVIAGARIALPVGNANQHRTGGTLELYGLPQPASPPVSDTGGP